MKLEFTNILRNIVLEQSREEVLLTKFTKPRKKKKKTLPALMDKTTFYQLVKADPTTRVAEDNDQTEVKKVGAYTQWIIKKYMELPQEADKAYAYGSNEWGVKLEQLQATFMEDLYKTTEDLQKFNRFKNKIPQEKRDINRIASPDELYDIVKEFSLEEAQTSKADRVLKDAELVYDSSKWDVVIPKSREAACHHGSNTRWCTAGSSNNYYDHYSKQGPLYIITNKKDPTDKYQFHFESNQYMDKEDRQVELSKFLNERPELKEFFKEMFKTFLDEDKRGKRVQVKYPGDAVSKYIGIYGFDEFMESLPNDLIRFDFETSGGYGRQEELAARPLPEKFTTFSNLEILHIEGLLNALPENIGNLKKLKFLSLAKNPELKSLPASLATIPTLEVINLKGSPNVEIPPELKEKDDNDELIIITE